MITLRDIAAEAGVSEATVSRALSGNPRCAAATRERIRLLAERMGYRPDPGVSALARRRLGKQNAYSLVYLTETPALRKSRSEQLLFDALRAAAGRLGYTLTAEDAQSLGGVKAVSRVLYQRGVVGVVLSCLRRPELLAHFDPDRFSVVAMDQESFAVPFDEVQPDHYRAFFDALQLALDRGHRRIGVVLPSAVYSRQNEEILGAVAYHAERNAKRFCPPLILLPDPDQCSDHYYPKTQSWFQEYQPTCVISKTDGAYWPLKDLGLRIPEEVSFLNTNLLIGALPACSGFDPLLENYAEQVAGRMDALVRTGQRGVPERPLRLTFTPVWKAGDTFR